MLDLSNENEGDRRFLCDLSRLACIHAGPKLEELKKELEREAERYAAMEREIIFRLAQNWEELEELREWVMGLLALLVRLWFVDLTTYGFALLGGEAAFEDERWSLPCSITMLAIVLGLGMWGFGVLVGQMFLVTRLFALRLHDVIPPEIAPFKLKAVWGRAMYGLIAILTLLYFRVPIAERPVGRTMDRGRACRVIISVEGCSFVLEWVIHTVASKVLGFCYKSTPSPTSTTTNTNGFSFGNHHLSIPLGMGLFWWCVWATDVDKLSDAGIVGAEREQVLRRTLQLAVVFMAARLGRQSFYRRGFKWILLSDLG